MLKIKKLLYLSFSILLLAFSLLIPFTSIKNKDTSYAGASSVQLEIQKGLYIFKNTTDSNFIFPTNDFIIDNCNISYANPTAHSYTNGNRIVYDSSTQSLLFQVYDYKKQVIVESSAVISSGSWVSGLDTQPRYLFFNETILLDSEVWNFFDKSTDRQFSNSLWCTIYFYLLGFDTIGNELNFINNNTRYKSYRFYLLNDDLLSSNINDSAIYNSNDNFVSSFGSRNGYYYITCTFVNETIFFDSVYSIKLYSDYFFYTLANNNMNLKYYNNKFYNFEFQIINSTTYYFGIGFDDHYVKYCDIWNLTRFINIGYYDSQSSHINWVASSYNPLIINITSIIDKSSLEFIYNNFYLSNDYYNNIVNNKNKALEMLKEDYTLLNLFTTMFDASLNTFKSMFNFNFFGFNLFSLFCALLTISIVLIIFKLLKGR